MCGTVISLGGQVCADVANVLSSGWTQPDGDMAGIHCAPVADQEDRAMGGGAKGVSKLCPQRRYRGRAPAVGLGLSPPEAGVLMHCV